MDLDRAQVALILSLRHWMLVLVRRLEMLFPGTFGIDWHRVNHDLVGRTALIKHHNMTKIGEEACGITLTEQPSLWSASFLEELMDKIRAKKLHISICDDK